MSTVYEPDFVVKPGETIKESMEVLGMNQTDLAKRMGLARKTVNEIISAKTEITPETALRLENVFGVPSNFWNNLERRYRDGLARRKERKRLKKFPNWMKKIPVWVLVKMGWIKPFKDPVDQMIEVLKFFGVSSPQQWNRIWGSPKAVYRKSKVFESNPGAMSAWLRKGELIGQEMRCNPYNRKKFMETLKEIRALTREGVKVFYPKTIRLCSESGVAVVFLPEVPGAKVSGATRWISPKKALMQLSLRHKSDDHLWFTFFHEAGHILKHKKKDVFIEDDQKDEKEREADRFASDFLIPPKKYEEFLGADRLFPNGIALFARSIGISPGIVLGRLQHDGHLRYNQLNGLKTYFQWTEVVR